jgi:hypothetical protein
MARAHRLATILAVLTSLYALLFFAILPVPFVHEDVAVKVLPTVCRFSDYRVFVYLAKRIWETGEWGRPD